MERRLGWLGVLAGVVMLAGCFNNEPAGPAAGEGRAPSMQPGFGLPEECSVDPQFVNTTGTAAYETVLDNLQTDEDLWIHQHPVTNESGICRVYVEWDEGTKSYEWDDYIGYFRWNSYQDCTHIVYPEGIPVLDEYNAFVLEDSRDKVLAALADTETYNTDCAVFVNPQSGVRITYVTFTDYDDPFSPLTRTVEITVTP